MACRGQRLLRVPVFTRKRNPTFGQPVGHETDVFDARLDRRVERETRSQHVGREAAESKSGHPSRGCRVQESARCKELSSSGHGEHPAEVGVEHSLELATIERSPAGAFLEDDDRQVLSREAGFGKRPVCHHYRTTPFVSPTRWPCGSVK